MLFSHPNTHHDSLQRRLRQEGVSRRTFRGDLASMQLDQSLVCVRQVSLVYIEETTVPCGSAVPTVRRKLNIHYKLNKYNDPAEYKMRTFYRD